MVIIEGASAAGKSRLAFETIHAYAPKRWLIVPAEATSLREITKAGVVIRRAVIWLDDVERFLVSGGLDGAVLDALCPPGVHDVLVVATLRSEARQELSGAGLEISTARAVEEVMRRARVVALERDLTGPERERAEAFRYDDRIAGALDQTTGAGFAEYIAAGPAALERWESAKRGENLTAGAIISAAVDARRVGHLTPISRALLERLHFHYLSDREHHRRDRPSFDDALAWATQLVKGASGCIDSAGDNTFKPFDYLIDHAQRTASLNNIPGPVWSDLASHAPMKVIKAIGAIAYKASLLNISEQAFRRAADTSDTDAMYGLGLLLGQLRRFDEAEIWLRRAAEADSTNAMTNLGRLLDELGRADEGEIWLRRAAEADSTNAMTDLGLLLEKLGRAGEAEIWLRRAAEADSTQAMTNLGLLLEELGRFDEAEIWLCRAAEADSTNAMTNLGLLLEKLGRAGEGEIWLRRAAEADDTDAMTPLGLLLAEIGRADEAEIWLRRAAEADSTNAMIGLGLVLDEIGRADEAETWFRRAAEADDTNAMTGLGLLLEKLGRADEGEIWLRRAAEADNTNAMTALGLLLAESGRADEAEQWHRRAGGTHGNDGNR
ncbi:SEL1-like repeat protein [Actinoallomurus vinaceus]